MSILSYIYEKLITEDRFKFEKPNNIAYKGVHQTYTRQINNGVSINYTVLFDFYANDTTYTMVLTNTVLYNNIKTSNGEIQFTTSNNMVFPVYSPNKGENVNITDDVMASDIGKEVKSALDTNYFGVVVNRAFDVSLLDPSKSEEDFATTNKGNPISTINKTYYVLKKYLDNFSSIYDNDVKFVFFDFDYMSFADNIKHTLEAITLVAKPDYEGDMRRANLYNRWWEAKGSEIGHITGIEKHNTNQGVEFIISFKDTEL